MKNTSLKENNTNTNDFESTSEINEDDLKGMLQIYAQGDEEFSDKIKEVSLKKYPNNLLQAKSEIANMLAQTNLNQKSNGYLFLPEHPANYPSISDQQQIDVPLILQNHPDWQKINYGVNQDDYLGDTGCAIVSLAMVHATLSKKDVQPQDILNWAQEHYFVAGSGTSWQIFADFADEFQYQFMNYGNDFYAAMEAVQNGQIVVASVKPGYFTDVGHIIVVRGYNNGKVFVNDPNDDIEKMHSIKGIDEQIFLTEGVNYWSFGQL